MVFYAQPCKNKVSLPGRKIPEKKKKRKT